MNDRLKVWGRILGVLALCILISFIILHLCPDAWPYIILAWALAIVCGLPGILTFYACRAFRNTLRCWRDGTPYPGTCTDVRYQARERLYVIEWENADGSQTRPPFPVTVYEWGEHRCLGKPAVIEKGIFALVFLLIQIGAAIPVILIACDVCSRG